MKNKQFKIELLTPALCHGADKNAEIRVPSIRGHLRKWHTILWGKDDMEYCWGTAGKDDTIASKVVLRIVTDSANLAVFSTSMLPHKKSALTNAVKNNQSFVLEVSYRYLEDDKRQSVINKVEKTIELWLLLGTFGQRGTRAFGSVWNQEASLATPQSYIDAVKAILKTSKYAVQVFKSNKPANMNEILKSCTDTIGGHPDLLGDIKPRQTSPLKMKTIKLKGEYFLVLHAVNHSIIDNTIKLLQNKPVGKNFTVIASNK